MTETVLIAGGVVLLLVVGVTLGVLVGFALCRHGHPRHWRLDEPAPYTPDDGRWWAGTETPVREPTREMPTYALPEPSILAQRQFVEPTAETLRQWQRGERL